MASITESVAAVKAFGSTATLVTAGVTASHDLASLYQAITDGTLTLPCLLVVPELGQQSGWQAMTMMGNAPEIRFNIEHYLLFRAVAGSSDFPAILSSELALIDAYFAALKLYPFFNTSGTPGTHYAPETSYKIAKTKWGETEYHTMVFVHKMRLNL